MESKSLKTIQMFAKLGKICSTIIYVFTVVGFIGCIVGTISLVLFQNFESINVGGITIHSMTEKGNMNLPSCYLIIMFGLVFCLFEGELCRSAKRYFKNELEAGTPFTMEGAKELRTLGIKIIVLPVVAMIIAQVIYQVMNMYYPDIMDIRVDDFMSVGIGLMFVFLSVVCRYGAELKEKVSE